MVNVIFLFSGAFGITSLSGIDVDGVEFHFYRLGSTAVGLKTKEGVVLAVEKRITSPLQVSNLYF